MNKMMNIAAVAAALVLSAGAASAQAMKATVPFDFEASGTRMTAGTYVVSQNGYVHRLADPRNGHAIMVAAESKVFDPKNVARLVFNCAGDRCALAAMYTGDSGIGATFRSAISARDKEVRQVAVLLTSGSAK
jgi:hypothetical protein